MVEATRDLPSGEEHQMRTSLVNGRPRRAGEGTVGLIIGAPLR